MQTSGQSAIRGFVKSKGLNLLIITAAIVLFFWIMNPNYLSENNIKGIMNACSLSGTITVGMACLLMSGSIDLAAGAEGCFGGVLIALLLRTGMAWPPALLLTLLYGVLAGLFNSFLSNVLGFMPFIATIGMASVWKGFALLATDAQTIPISDKDFWKLGQTTIGVFPMPFIIMVALMIVYGLMLTYTRFGRRIMLCGGNPQAARLSGINTKKISTIMFMNNGAIAALAGSILASRMQSGSPNSVQGAEMDGMTAAIIGGVAFLGGGSSGMGVVFVGLIMLNCFNNGLQMINLPAYYQVIAQGALLIIALILDRYREKHRAAAMLKAQMKLERGVQK
jgi:ribose/xylose/arabinose/galactoside ABC-type transport system permease subunit